MLKWETIEISIEYHQTETDSDRTELLGWRLLPQNIPVMNVAPPIMWSNLRDVSDRTSGVALISDELHNALLEESLSEYDELWNQLALK